MKMMKVEFPLPLEIAAHILSRLPVNLIVECKHVCKTWRTLIDNDPLFLFAFTSTAHSQSSSSIPNSVAEVEAETQPYGSSNGLICLSACQWNASERHIFIYNIYVYNPMTREFVDVGTETHTAAGRLGGCRASEFGYHPSTKEYKVVRINYETNFSRSGQVKVYTLGSCGCSSSRWRDKGEIPYVIKGVIRNHVIFRVYFSVPFSIEYG